MTSAPLKIGILTYTSNFNYGTFFQAYATLCLLQRHFPSGRIEFINYNSATKLESVGYHKLNLKKRHLHPGYLIKHLRKQQGYRQTQADYLQFDTKAGLITDSYDSAAQYIDDQGYDLVVVGSDTVLNFYDWNLQQDELPIYWLPSGIKAKKVMLASSIGTDLTLADLTEAQQERVRSSINGFELLGVRDELTQDFIHTIEPGSASRVKLIPDPTLSYTLNTKPAADYLRKRRVSLGAKTIGLDLPTSVRGVEQAVKHYKDAGYTIVTWRGRSKYADFDFSDLSPLEWSGIFAHFAITLTNRFHASIFSLKNETPVITVDFKSNRVTESQKSKASMLLESFGIRDGNYANATAMADDWVLQAMQASLENPGTAQLRARAAGMNEELDRYVALLSDLF